MKNNEQLKENRKKYKLGEFEGITLISLVITIVVLIILASVAIYLSLGNNGIFTRAKQAKELTNKQEATEKINLKITTAQMNKYAEEQRMPTLKELSEALIDDEIEYVTEQSKKQASTEYNVPSENPSSIYTKLNKYPYEFEINGQLQLASIDGIKVATNQNTNSSSTVLLEQIDISVGQELELTGNIYDYEKIEIFTAVPMNDVYAWASQSIYTQDIKLSIGNTNRTQIPIAIMSSPHYYRTPHYTFTDNNKILLFYEQGEGWDTFVGTYKIRVVGY